MYLECTFLYGRKKLIGIVVNIGWFKRAKRFCSRFENGDVRSMVSVEPSGLDKWTLQKKER